MMVHGRKVQDALRPTQIVRRSWRDLAQHLPWRAGPDVGGAALVGGGHGPRALHAPHGEGVAEALMGHVAAAGHLIVHLVALQDLVEEVYVPGGQLERLDLAELVRGQRGDDLAQRGEGLVERLSALALAHVGQDALAITYEREASLTQKIT